MPKEEPKFQGPIIRDGAYVSFEDLSKVERLKKLYNLNTTFYENGNAFVFIDSRKV